jgi:hypothetical protein
MKIDDRIFRVLEPRKATKKALGSGKEGDETGDRSRS